MKDRNAGWSDPRITLKTANDARLWLREGTLLTNEEAQAVHARLRRRRGLMLFAVNLEILVLVLVAVPFVIGLPWSRDAKTFGLVMIALALVICFIEVGKISRKRRMENKAAAALEPAGSKAIEEVAQVASAIPECAGVVAKWRGSQRMIRLRDVWALQDACARIAGKDFDDRAVRQEQSVALKASHNT